MRCFGDEFLQEVERSEELREVRRTGSIIGRHRKS